MTLQELGQSIREHREAAGLSIDDVAARIKVSTRILKSIEEGSLVGLPHAVYTKSFIRAFGLLVGLNAEELHAHLEVLFPPESLDETRAESSLRSTQQFSYPGRGKRIFILVLLLLILVGIGAGGWYVAANYGATIIEYVKKPFSAITSPSGGENQEPAPPSESSTSGAVTSSALTALIQSPSTAARQSHFSSDRGRAAAAPPAEPGSSSHAPAAESNSPAQAGVDASGGENASTTDAAATESASGNEPGETSAQQPASRETNTVVISAHHICWVGVKADGKSRHTTLQSGQSATFTYTSAMEITLGNAGGVKILHNGKDIGTAGGSGQRAVVRFPLRAED